MLFSLRRLQLEVQRFGAPRIGVYKDVTGLVTPCELQNPCSFIHFGLAVSEDGEEKIVAGMGNGMKKEVGLR